MASGVTWDNIELHLVRVLHTVIAERSVSRAALRLGSTQPVVSAQLKRLRALTGDPLLVRAGRGLVPTELALQLHAPAQALLRQAAELFEPQQRRAAFAPQACELTVRVAASDYLDPHFLPALVAHLREQAPGLLLELEPLSGSFDVEQRLGAGEADLVIGNWLYPPQDLHLGRLISDEVVCLVSADHIAVRQPRQWTVERYLACEHVAPAALHRGGRGIIEEQLQAQGLQRHIAVRAAHFSLIPPMVARTQLVLTSGRQFCSRFVEHLPLQIVRCPVPMPPMAYYQLWHERSHRSPAQQWLREQVRGVARGLRAKGEEGSMKAREG